MAAYTGTDFSTYTTADGRSDLDPNWTEISGERVLVEHFARRLETAAGTMHDESFGFDLKKYYNANLSAADKRRIQAGVRGEGLKVEGVEDCEVEVIQGADGVVEITGLLYGADDDEYPFVFHLNAESVKLIPLLG